VGKHYCILFVIFSLQLPQPWCWL